MSTVVHQLGVKIHSKIEGEKHLLAAAWECDKPLVNFAPYGKNGGYLSNGKLGTIVVETFEGHDSD